MDVVILVILIYSKESGYIFLSKILLNEYFRKIGHFFFSQYTAVKTRVYPDTGYPVDL